MKSAVTWTVTSLHVIWGLSGYLHFFVCFLGLVSSLVMELSSVYSSSVMVKDFFEFFFLEVLEPESLCTPQSWGFFSQILFQIFFPVPVLFPLWGSDGASVAAVLLPADLGVCARCCQSRSFPSACLPVRPPFFCHLQPARDAICDISASVLNCRFILLLGCSFLTETSDPSLCFQSVCPYYINHGFWSIFSNNANVCVISALMSVDWLLLYKLSFPYCF